MHSNGFSLKHCMACTSHYKRRSPAFLQSSCCGLSEKWINLLQVLWRDNLRRSRPHRRRHQGAATVFWRRLCPSLRHRQRRHQTFHAKTASCGSFLHPAPLYCSPARKRCSHFFFFSFFVRTVKYYIHDIDFSAQAAGSRWSAPSPRPPSAHTESTYKWIYFIHRIASPACA